MGGHQEEDVGREGQQMPALPLTGCVNLRGARNPSELACSPSVKAGQVMLTRGLAGAFFTPSVSQEVTMGRLVICYVSGTVLGAEIK